MKPGKFTQLYIHFVIAVKYRRRLLRAEIRPYIFRHMSAILTNRDHKSIIVNGVSDHIHILIGMNPDDKIADLVATIKRSSSLFINKQNWFNGNFHWQDGYGAFSYSRSQISRVFGYIENQEIHHNEETFRSEYIKLLKQYNIKYDERYLFDFFE